MTVVGWTEEPTVVVDEGTEVVTMDVLVCVMLTTGVMELVIVAVVVTVVVCCGPTDSEKSRSYAIGSPFPLFEMINSDHSPLVSLLFGQSEQVMSCGVSSGVKLESEHWLWSPLGSTKMLLAVSFWQPSNSCSAVNGSLDRLFWKYDPPF